jgi:predicted ribosomally synthesized peptide with SipW-like signal peptide
VEKVKKIVGLSIAAVLVIGLAVGGTLAQFTDVEGPQEVSFTAGTVDIAIDDGTGLENPWTGTVVIEGAKPCQVKYVDYEITNVGENPVVVYKHLIATIADPDGDPVTDTGILAYPDSTTGPFSSEPESDAAGGDPNNDVNDLHNYIRYDLYSEVTLGVGGIPPTLGGGKGWHQWEYDENVYIGELFCERVVLGTIMPGGTMYVLQSYHIDEALGDIYQGDRVTFYVEFYAVQLEGTTVLLENKTDAPGESYVDFTGRHGLLDYNSEGPTFDYTFEATGLQLNTSYSLIYYADPWPGTGGCLIATFTSDGSGDIISTSGSVDLGMDLPIATDDNAPQGAKIWLVPSTHYSTTTPGVSGQVTTWAESLFLFETHTIKYDDTDV